MLTDDDHTKDQPRTRQTPARRVPYHDTIFNNLYSFLRLL